MKKARALSALAALLLVAGCGDGVIDFGGDFSKTEGSDNITVKGNVRQVLNPNGERPIAVFVYTNVAKDARLPFLPGEYESFGTTSIAAGSIGSDPGGAPFSISNLRRGTLTVVFLFDHPKDGTPGPDGSIDCDDVTIDRALHCEAASTTTVPATVPAAVLGSDPTDNAVATLVKAGELKDVLGGSTVTIPDIDVNFNNPAAPSDQPAIAEAKADGKIVVNIDRSGDNAGQQ